MLNNMRRNEDKEAKSNLLPLYLNKYDVGKVHSKFSKGFNVQFEKVLIFISSVNVPLSASGLRLNEEVFKKLLNAINLEDVVVSKTGKLLFYCNSEIMTIDYSNLEVIDLTIPHINCRIDQISYTKLYEHLSKIEFENLIGIVLDDVACDNIELLLNSDKDNFIMDTKIIRYFTGRGKGLTPSGDDIIMGFSLAIMLFGKFDNWIRAIQSNVTPNSTTMISVNYINALLKGYVSETFLDLSMLLDEKDDDIIENIIKMVQSYGHTSGNDTLFGFFLGLKYLIKYERKLAARKLSL